GARLPDRPALPGLDVGGAEVLEGEAEVRHLAAVEPGSGLEGVVLGQRVREAVALDDGDLAAVAGQLAPGDADQHADQRDVEDEVAGLPQQPALCADGPRSGLLADLRAVAGAAQGTVRPLDQRVRPGA